MATKTSSNWRSWRSKTALLLTLAMLAATLQGVAVETAGASGRGSVSRVSVSVTPDVAGVSGAAYTIGFKASAMGALVADSGTITVTAAPGTKLSECALITDLVTHISLDSCAGGYQPAASITITTEVAVGAGDEVQMVFDQVTNAITVGPHVLRVATSADAANSGKYALVARGGAVSNLSVLVTPALAGASGAAYTINFKASATGALVASSGTMTVSTAPGTKLPSCALVTDLVTHASEDSCVGGAPASSMTFTTEVAVGDGDEVQVVLAGATNSDVVGLHQLAVSTSTDAGAITHYVLTARTGAVSGVSLALTNAASRASGVDYTIKFRASAKGALVADSGTITVTAAPGTKLSDCALVTDLATHSSLDSCAGSHPPGATITITTEVAIGAGDEVEMVFEGVTNPDVAGLAQLRVSTSTDASGSAGYSLAASGAIEGNAIDSEHNVVEGGLLQACATKSRLCYTTPIGRAGRFSTFLPLGSYVLTVYPQSSYLEEATSPGPVALRRAGSISRRTIIVRALAPLPNGVDIAGQDGGVPAWRWDDSAPMTVHGCTNGVGAVTISGTNTQTGQPARKIFLMSESPPGSGRYSVTIPPLWPIHGTATVSYKIYCFEAVLPKAGPAAGGNVVLVHGSGFSGVTAVEFGTAPALHFHVLSSSVIEAVAPPGSGTVDVSVVTLHGTAKGGAKTAYAYISLRSLSPSYGSTSASTRVVITGYNLGDVDTIWFGDHLAAGTQFVSNNEIVAFAPPGSGTVPVRMGEIGATGSGLTLSGPPYTLFFHYGARASSVPAAQAPLVALWSPDIGRLPPTAIEAADFSAAGSSGGPTATDWGGLLTAEGTFGGAAAAVLGALGTIFPSSYFALSTSAIVGTAIETTVTTAGIVAGGLAIAAAVAIVLGLYLSMSTSNNNSSPGTCQCGEEGPGQGSSGAFSALIDPSGTVMDTNGNPVAGAMAFLEQAPTPEGPFRLADPASPGILPHNNPERTKADGQFHWEVISDYYKIVATARGCYAPGNPAQPSVSTPALPVPPPQLGVGLVFQCAHEALPKRPAVASVPMGELPSAGTAQVDIVGRGFTPSSVVHFGTARSPSVKYASPQLLIASAPPGRGRERVSVTTAGGTSPAAPADVVKYTPAPVVEKISPATGAVKGGTRVVVQGAGFSRALVVIVGGAVVTHFSVKSDDEIALTMPPGHAGVVGIRVLTLLGLSPVTHASQFTYVPAVRSSHKG
jgi:hypothetical protein